MKTTFAAEDYQPPQEPWLDILYQDDWLAAINKPSGLLSTPGRDPGLQDSVATRIKSLSPYAELVHRLDMDTSGVLLLALRKQTESALKTQFQERKTSKVYLARVWGQPPEAEGEIDLPLICDWPRRPLQKVCFEKGKPSKTRYRLLEKDKETSLLELHPITGRSHQLRVHLMSLGCPILGDRFYAQGRALAASNRLLLHALQLTFTHPESAKQMTMMAPCDFA
ncbi:ribosomal large subunit pseudouridine synthase A [Marinospirillum celere]|uniref:Pseudouridine synthase n=1 Tax=Marinospirillum celere TaxID=1122252 RepID=A0A1I1IA31_9GAMM|nr:bifunctional tRNA pseudouridine(32) synthase/23S rRNA pseudouridine(746) synthase RluA [Marinospirillum celere]SFC32881.1 ribosomal large subunit pseudouridine synthase A [Marinospirillum celere]